MLYEVITAHRKRPLHVGAGGKLKVVVGNRIAVGIAGSRPLKDNVRTVGLMAQNKAEVKIVQAETWKNNQNIIKNANRLLGDVIIDHADIRMWCDSAYMYTDTNIVDAFGRVHT